MTDDTTPYTLDEALKRVQGLVPGDPVDYNGLTRVLDQADSIEFEIRCIYSDQSGFLERWYIDGDEVLVIDGLSSPLIVRDICSHNLEGLRGQAVKA